jgi:alkylation response protein AidB-like acyl-CoA dehydrogenase
MAIESEPLLAGASFLLTSVTSANFLTPERFDDEQKAVREMARTFIEREVLPKAEAIDHQEEGLLRSLLRRAGAQGLLGVDVPEAYGGQDLGLVYSAIIASEQAEGSFAVAIGAQTTIGLLPIVYYGNDEQKAKYLPGMVEGETVSCYCLTEPGVGSDAMAIKSRATLSEDGKYYILNGAKQWISNGGIADLGIVFAKIDDVKYTAFIVDMHTPGIRLGAEEKKMGIKGSSTRAVFFEDVKVPVEDVLGEIGKGYKIAFNILNIGRLKLGVGGTAAARKALELSTDYAKTRRAFGQPISNFGLIKQKLAGMMADGYAIESLSFRAAALVESARAAAGDNQIAQANSLEEFSIEAAIAKVFGSEGVGRIVDEGVQIFGGNGFMQEYPIEKAYRDARITRIFEGTNEINRLLASGQLFDRAMKNRIDLFGPFNEVEGQIQSGQSPDFASEGVPGELRSAVNVIERSKRAAIYGTMKAAIKFMTTIREEQEFLAAVSDMLINLFAMDSAVGRALQAARATDPQSKLHSQVANYVVWRQQSQFKLALEHAIEMALEGTDRASELKLVRDYLIDLDVNSTQLSRDIADAILAKGGYLF